MDYKKHILGYIRRHDPFGIHRFSVWVGSIFRPNAKHTPGKNNTRKIIRVYNSQSKNLDYSDAAINKLKAIALGVGDFSEESGLRNECHIRQLLQADTRKLQELRHILGIEWLKKFVKELSEVILIDPDLLRKIIDFPPFFTHYDFDGILKILGDNINEAIIKAIFNAGVTYPIHEQLKKLKQPLSKEYVRMTFRQVNVLEALKAMVELSNNNCLNERMNPRNIEDIVSRPNAVELAKKYYQANNLFSQKHSIALLGSKQMPVVNGSRFQF